MFPVDPWRHMHAKVAADTQLAGIAAKKYLGTKWVASAHTMQSKAYTKELQPENWAVSMDIYHLSSAPMPELQWLSW